MKNPELRTGVMTAAALILVSTLNLSIFSMAQESAPAAASQPGDASLHDLGFPGPRTARQPIEQMRNENAQSRAEMQELRQELQETRKLLAPLAASTSANPSSVCACQRGIHNEHCDFRCRYSTAAC